MKLAFVLPSASGGGAERAMISVANHLAANGHSVEVVLGRAAGPYLSEISGAARIVDLGVRRYRELLGPLNRYVKAAKPDILLSCLVPCDIALLAGRIIFGWRSRILISLQNHPVEVGRHGQYLTDRFWPLFIRLLYGRADHLVAISHGVGSATENILQRKPGSIPVIHNPVITPDFARKLAEPPVHRWFDGSGIPVLLAAGRLTRQKDYPMMLRAFAAVLKRRSARLIILGDGEDREDLIRLSSELAITEHVDFAGFNSNPYAVMRAADLFLLSSRWEGFANVVAEALACGTPIVSTDCPSGPSEIMAAGAYGELVPVGNADAFADAILRTLDQPRDRARLSARGLEFSVERLAPKYAQICGVSP
jgi:glycosyltransferase involved in cell wall biosynthesis